MNLFKDFKNFIAKGNLMDLAVGVMIGAAFNSLVSSMVNNLLNPMVGIFLGKSQLSDWQVEFELPLVSDGVPPDTVILSYGKFFQEGIDFLIMAFVVFLIVKLFHSIKTKAEDPNNKDVQTPKDIELLGDIRKILSDIAENNKS